MKFSDIQRIATESGLRGLWLGDVTVVVHQAPSGGLKHLSRTCMRLRAACPSRGLSRLTGHALVSPVLTLNIRLTDMDGDGIGAEDTDDGMCPDCASTQAVLARAAWFGESLQHLVRAALEVRSLMEAVVNDSVSRTAKRSYCERLSLICTPICDIDEVFCHGREVSARVSGEIARRAVADLEEWGERWAWLRALERSEGGWPLPYGGVGVMDRFRKWASAVPKDQRDMDPLSPRWRAQVPTCGTTALLYVAAEQILRVGPGVLEANEILVDLVGYRGGLFQLNTDAAKLVAELADQAGWRVQWITCPDSLALVTASAFLARGIGPREALVLAAAVTR